MSLFSGYKTTAFKETQKFFVLDPATGSPSFVQGSDLVSYLRPSLNSVDVETTTDAAVNADYDVGKVIQTTGESSPGDGNPGLFLVVAAGTGGIPMLNGNELLVLEGANTALGISYDNTSSGLSAENVQAAIDEVDSLVDANTSDILDRVIYVDTVTELEALPSPLTGQEAMVSGTPFKYDGTEWLPSAGFITGAAFGVVVGPAEDNTAELNVAASYKEGKYPILLYPGETRYTGTLNLELNTTFFGPKGDGGLFAGYTAFLNYAPGAAVKTTLNGAINDSQTSITLTDASGLPTSGRIYLNSINGEWIDYTDKSGDVVTGCTRNSPGGTVGAPTDVTGQAYPDGTTVWLARPAMQKTDGAFSGGLVNVALYHDGFVSEATGWADLGVGLYFPQASYAHIIDNALVYGFEKAGYFGEAYLTTLISPMVYRVRYGYQFDTGNAATASDVDMGVIGNATSGAGWGFYFRGGNGASITGGNLSNGGVNIPVISDSHQELKISGTYTEATSNDLFSALNNGSIFVNGHYAKGSTNFGRIASGGKVFIDGLEYENVNFPRVQVSSGGTGRWSIKNAIDIDGGYVKVDDQYGIDEARYDVPSWDAADSSALAPRVYHSKSITDNTLTDVLKFRTEPDGATPDITVGATINYTYGTNRNAGQAAEQGEVQLIIKHRINNPPAVSIAKGSSTQVLEGGTTSLSVSWSQTTTLISGDRYEVTVEITAVESLGNDGELTVVVESSKPPFRRDDLSFGFLTLL